MEGDTNAINSLRSQTPSLQALLRRIEKRSSYIPTVEGCDHLGTQEKTRGHHEGEGSAPRHVRLFARQGEGAGRQEVEGQEGYQEIGDVHTAQGLGFQSWFSLAHTLVFCGGFCFRFGFRVACYHGSFSVCFRCFVEVWFRSRACFLLLRFAFVILQIGDKSQVTDMFGLDKEAIQRLHMLRKATKFNSLLGQREFGKGDFVHTWILSEKEFETLLGTDDSDGDI
ncbi:hypothetical protein DM02DRAFT_340259 [Periconia macrospinosa]|uniref:Uncharacterized protein n=1 Tax=Periconia macrospinosa TaxID=97972 RepID=A0A2V1D0B8_9PLEO|nr:hypothetical protein DM02DRAFT_340259 [Periconia macrospinosa]